MPAVHGKAIIVLVLATLWLAACTPRGACLLTWDPCPAPGTTLAGFELRGSEAFTRQIVHALKLLRERDPDAFREARTYIGRIAQGRRSGMWAFATPPTLELADRTTFFSVSWSASVIAHDAVHSRRFHEYRSRYGRPVPAAAWTGQGIERLALRHQCAVLARVGAPQAEIDYCRGLDGSHHDTNGDGRYDEQDDRARKW